MPGLPKRTGRGLSSFSRTLAIASREVTMAALVIAMIVVTVIIFAMIITVAVGR
ncbi:MAG: hypothetical protein KDK10_06840 [Maritimibacter sp.]|nr:hypothetical protein [Maritimibacter sp.]